jgi:Na+/phosphate symporter
MSREALIKSLSSFAGYNEKEADEIIAMEDKVDTYEDKLGSYLVKISMHELSVPDSQEAAKLLHVIGDFERISDHAVNIIRASQEMKDKGVRFSEQAKKEVGVMSTAVTEILTKAVDCFVQSDVSLAAQVEPLEQVIDTLRTEIRDRHVQRLQSGECTIELGFILSDIVTNLERVADHCSNIAVSVIELEKYGALDAHEYLREVKSGHVNSTFQEMYKEYAKKYSLI